MRAKLSRDGPEGNPQQNTVTNVSDFSLDTDFHNVEPVSQAPEENEMSFLEALSADSLNGHLITDFDMPTSSTDSNMVQCASANTWLPDNDFLDDDAENLDCSLLDSFCDPYLYQAPADPFDQTLFCHCESMDIQHNHFPLSSWHDRRHKVASAEYSFYRYGESIIAALSSNTRKQPLS